MEEDGTGIEVVEEVKEEQEEINKGQEDGVDGKAEDAVEEAKEEVEQVEARIAPEEVDDQVTVREPIRAEEGSVGSEKGGVVIVVGSGLE